MGSRLDLGENRGGAVVRHFKLHEGREIGLNLFPYQTLQFPECARRIRNRHARAVLAHADQQSSAIGIGKGDDRLQCIFRHLVGILQMEVRMGARTLRLILHGGSFDCYLILPDYQISHFEGTP